MQALLTERDRLGLTLPFRTPKIGRMEPEIAALEQKLDALLVHVETLRRDNREQSARIASLETDNRRLAAKLEFAAEKIEAALALMPEGVEA